MKMVKSLLLGSAAGLVAVSAGQAADLPVKAKPVEYVKVCSLYGAGFYYIPGTETCIKVGGFLRTEINVHAAGSFTNFSNGGNAFQFRAEDNFVTRARAALTVDAREQTSYGTLRGYLAAGWQYTTDDPPTVTLPGSQATGTTVLAGGTITSTFSPTSNNGSLYLLRAFIQWGGFTFGKTASFYDFLNTSKYTLQTNFIYQDFAGVGVFTYGYTQQLGNGFAATIAGQDDTPFEHNIVNLNPINGSTLTTINNVFLLNAPVANNISNAGTLVPDIVGAIRVDQQWGGAQVAAIAHDNRATYYSDGSGTANPQTTLQFLNGVVSGSDHPDDKWGFAVQGGLELNLQNWGWSQGDSVVVQGQYCVGFSMACYNNSGTRFNDLAWSLINDNKIALGWLDDAFFANSRQTGRTDLELATNWNVFAAIQHYWTPDVRTSLYGGYANYQANSSALDVLVCQGLNSGNLPAAQKFGIGQNLRLLNGTTVSPTGCADWATWTIGSRTLWNPVKNLDVGVDVLYSAMAKTAFEGATIATTVGGGAATQTLTAADTHIWAGILRIQYNFYP